MPNRVFAGLLAFLAIAACGRSDICNDDGTPPSELGPDALPDPLGPGALLSSVDGFRGLWTSPDDLEAPEGALSVAQNVALYRPGMLEPRRGEEWLSYTSAGGTIDASIEFQGYPVIHYGTTIKRWNGSSWTAYSGSYAPRSGKPARFFVASGSLFFLSSAGVYELDAIGGTWRLTGSPKGLQGSAALRKSTSETGFATANGQWAYRYVWGYINANGKLQLGAPSGRFLLTSPANITATTGQVSKTTGTATVTVSGPTHGLTTGDYVDVTLGGAETHFVAGRFSVTVASSTSFTYNDGGDAAYTGAPSNSITYGFTSRNSTLTAPIPSGITVDYFLQVYRSAKSADANSEPSDAMGLVVERPPTNLEIAAGSMTVTDLTPDELRGATLYTSLGEQPHNQPPACSDAVVFRDGTLYSCTAQLQTMELSLLGVGGATGIQLNDGIYVIDSPGNFAASTWNFFVLAKSAENVAAGEFKLYTAGSTSQNIADTAKSLVRTINGYASNSKVYAEYVSADTDAPGKIRVYGRDSTIPQFTLTVYIAGIAAPITPSAFAPTLTCGDTSANIWRAGTTVTVDTMSFAHGFAVGQLVYLDQSSDTSAFPNGAKTVVSVPTTTSLTYTEAGTAVGSGSGKTGVFYNQASDTFASFNSDYTNSVMWAPPDAPWNVPAINFKIVTPSNSTISALVSTRDRVLINSDRGLYQGQGDGSSWSFTEFDPSLNLKAPRTAILANGKAYGWFDCGFAEMVENARVVSVPIDKTLRDLLVNAPTAVASYAFAVPYETYRMVLLFVPLSSSDTAAKAVYALHTDTGDWTGPWDLNALSAGPVAGSGFISPTDGKLYTSSGGYVAKERKTLTAADQSGVIVPNSITATASSVTGTTITAAAVAAVASVGATIRSQTSGTTAVLTGISGNVLTVASTTGFADGHTVELLSAPITAAIQPVAITADEPGAQKMFIEGSLAFRHSEFTAGYLTFATDLSPTYSGATTLNPPGGSSANPTQIDFWVPQSWRRGTRLSMKFTQGGVGEWFGLQGWTLRSRLCSPRTTR